MLFTLGTSQLKTYTEYYAPGGGPTPISCYVPMLGWIAYAFWQCASECEGFCDAVLAGVHIFQLGNPYAQYHRHI